MTHSPTCELRCGLENKLQTMLNKRSDAMGPESSPMMEHSSPTMEYSSDETILVTPPRLTVDGQDLQEPQTVLQDIMPDQSDSCNHGVRVESEVCVDCSNSQDVTNKESCVQDITYDANAETCSQDVNPACSQDVTDIVINEVSSQDVSRISNEPCYQQDTPISGLQHVINNSGIISELGDSQDVISICPEQAYTPMSLEPQMAPSHTSNGLILDIDEEVTTGENMTPPNISSSDCVNRNLDMLAPTMIEPHCVNTGDNTHDSSTASRHKE